jgi:hypothetical protein
VIAAVVVVAALAAADPVADPVTVRVRVDPVVAVVGGASVGVDVGVDDSDVRVAAAAFVVDVPRPFVPLLLGERASLKITETAVQVGVFRSSEPGHRGFFFGPELYAYRLRTVDDARPTRAAVSRELYAHLTAGTVWFPFDDDDNDGFWGSFFVMPWATAGLPVWQTGGARFSDGTSTTDRRLNVHATISVGLDLL